MTVAMSCAHPLRTPFPWYDTTHTSTACEFMVVVFWCKNCNCCNFLPSSLVTLMPLSGLTAAEVFLASHFPDRRLSLQEGVL